MDLSWWNGATYAELVVSVKFWKVFRHEVDGGQTQRAKCCDISWIFPMKASHHALGVGSDDGPIPHVHVVVVLPQVRVQVTKATGASPGIGREVQVMHFLLWTEPIVRHHRNLKPELHPVTCEKWKIRHFVLPRFLIFSATKTHILFTKKSCWCLLSYTNRSLRARICADYFQHWHTNRLFSYKCDYWIIFFL